MKKLLILSLLISSLNLQAYTFLDCDSFSISQSKSEKTRGLHMEHDAPYACGIIGGATYGILATMAIKNHNPVTAQEALCIGAATVAGFFGTYYAIKDIMKDFSFGYSSLNEDLQKILKSRKNFNFNLIKIAENQTNLKGMIDSYIIDDYIEEYQNTKYPLITAANELRNTLSFCQTAQETLQRIVVEHEDLTHTENIFLCECISDLTSMLKIGKNAIDTISASKVYKSEIYQNDPVEFADLYKAAIKSYKEREERLCK